MIDANFADLDDLDGNHLKTVGDSGVLASTADDDAFISELATD